MKHESARGHVTGSAIYTDEQRVPERVPVVGKAFLSAKDAKNAKGASEKGAMRP